MHLNSKVTTIIMVISKVIQVTKLKELSDEFRDRTSHYVIILIILS